MKKIISLFLLILISLYGITQEDQAAKEKKFQAKLGTFFISHLHYYGRVDSLQSNGVFPLAELWMNKKFYLSAAPVFVNNSLACFDYVGTVATAGYQGKTRNEKFFAHIYFTKPFYTNGSALPQSVLKAQASNNIAYLNKFINLNGGIDFRLSDKMDYGLSAGLDHIFRVQVNKNMVLVADPSAYIYAGTQQFTNTYYKKSSFLFFPGIQQEVNEEVNKLGILSYEFSMPVILSMNKWQLIVNPAYVVPRNVIEIENRPDLSESARQFFYATAGVKLTL